jgi:hypothetical protein
MRWSLSDSSIPSELAPGFARTRWLPGRHIKCEKKCDWFTQPLRHSVKFLKRWGISASLNEAQEVYGHAGDLCKFLLGFAHLVPYLPDALTELSMQDGQFQVAPELTLA